MMGGKEDSTTMKRHRHTPEQIIRKLAEGEIAFELYATEGS